MNPARIRRVGAFGHFDGDLVVEFWQDGKWSRRAEVFDDVGKAAGFVAFAGYTLVEESWSPPDYDKIAQLMGQMVAGRQPKPVAPDVAAVVAAAVAAERERIALWCEEQAGKAEDNVNRHQEAGRMRSASTWTGQAQAFNATARVIRSGK